MSDVAGPTAPDGTQGGTGGNAGAAPTIRDIDTGRPWSWLAAGFNDLRRAAPVSLLWGAAFAIVGLAILWIVHANRWYNFLFPLVCGFMLMAPILVVGIYRISQALERGEKVTLMTPLSAWGRNISQIGLMGFILGLFFLAWIRFATLLFALYFGDGPHQAIGSGPPDLRQFIEQFILSAENLPFLIISTAIGAIFAFVVFSLSAFAVPMLLDRETDVLRAVTTSARAVFQNFWPMVVWSVLIALFTAAGMAVFFIGLTVTLPLVAHATWHAYRDVIDFGDTPKKGSN